MNACRVEAAILWVYERGPRRATGVSEVVTWWISIGRFSMNLYAGVSIPNFQMLLRYMSGKRTIEKDISDRGMVQIGGSLTVI